jgi:large subunit ribosomal protein L10
VAKELKHMMGREIAERLRGYESCVVIGLEKLDVDGSNRLRGKLADEKARLTVVHNRVARHALEELGWGDLASLLRGSTAIACGEDGVISVSKVLVDWANTEKSIVLKGALVEGAVVDEDGIRRLATIPDRPTLMAQIAAGVQGPIVGIARAIQGVMTGLARAMQQIAEQKEKNGAEG